jgi:hypothetical protein
MVASDFDLLSNLLVVNWDSLTDNRLAVVEEDDQIGGVGRASFSSLSLL